MQLDHLQSVVLICGLSGAGKTTAVQMLSDLGYFTVDNLPEPLMEEFFVTTKELPKKYAKTSLLLDVDSAETAERFVARCRTAIVQANNFRLIFLDCRSDKLLQRYSETRRPHPHFLPELDKTLLDAIERERRILHPLKEMAHVSLESSDDTVHDLRRKVRAVVESFGKQEKQKLRVNLVSFGFKHGTPFDCDMIMDVRFLPNPYFQKELRKKTGLDAAVADYVLEKKEAQEFLVRYLGLLEHLLPQYVFEGKSYLNIGIGCTGGKHRSVALAEEIQKKLLFHTHIVASIRHRDIERTGS